MAKPTEVPVTPAVLEWAIRQSGLAETDVAEAAGINLDELKAWLAGEKRPGITAVRSLAHVLRRPVAAFLLPRPPAGDVPEVKFRALPGGHARDLSPKERRFLRKTTRLQKMIAWLNSELDSPAPGVPRMTVDDSPSDAAATVRVALGIRLDAQLAWVSPSAAFDAWRAAVEELGVDVFLHPMGTDSCRGFSLWNDRAPVIAVNTAWNNEARVFTLLHELGHLVTRSNSACIAAPPAALTHAWDPVERWCERFAADVLIPEAALRQALAQRFGRESNRIDDIVHVRWLANRFRASMRAVTIRLIEIGAASWDLYRALPEAGDAKRGGRGRKGRDRQEIQEDTLGDHATALFRRAIQADILPRSQALTYLDVSDAALDGISRAS